MLNSAYKHFDKKNYHFIEIDNFPENIVNFLSSAPSGEKSAFSENLYNGEKSNENYKNFLKWLFQTFKTTEETFRKSLLKRFDFENCEKILITGCGNGDDIKCLVNLLQKNYNDRYFEIYAQDLCEKMVCYSWSQTKDLEFNGSIFYNVSNAEDLPYKSRYFDGVFHFGGINFFENIKKGIDEMERVTKIGGKIVFGDEGIGEWLIGTEYFNMLVENNPVWKNKIPLHLLPSHSENVKIEYLLGNCFWVIEFSIGREKFPEIDIGIEHKGPRGGSIRSLYFGKLEGVTQEAKELAINAAKTAGKSMHHWLDDLIKQNTN